MPGNPENKNEHLLTSRRILNPALVGVVTLLAAMDVHTLDNSVQRRSFGSASAEAHQNPTRAHAASAEPGEGSKHCTSIRRRANDIYIGFGCVEDGARFVKIGDGHREKGWVYGVVAIDGIYKCGFVKEGVLPSKKPRPRAVTHCRNYYEELVVDRYKFFEDYNCRELKRGLEGCRDGTYPNQASTRCPIPVTYRN